MPLELDPNSSEFQIRGYKPGIIQINEQIFNHSLIVTPNQLITHWQPQSASEISPTTLEPILELKPDVLLIGTGEKLLFIPVEYYGQLINAGIGVEVMGTYQASCTFNALSAENRNVVAALIV